MEKLTINSFTSQSNIKNLKNATIKELILNCGANPTLTSLEGIQNFPNLEILTVSNNPGLKDVVSIQNISITPNTCRSINPNVSPQQVTTQKIGVICIDG